MKQKKEKRIVSGILACVIFLITILTLTFPITSYGAGFAGRNIWNGGAEILFGSRRTYLYRWTKDGQNTFCIEPGRHMGKDVSVSTGFYHIDDEENPYIHSREDFERLALICDWYEKKERGKDAPNDAYAAAQAAIWAVTGGEWENAAAMAAQITPHVSGDVGGKINQLLHYVETAYFNLDGLPDWCSVSAAKANPRNMTLKNGQYELRLDLSSCPDMAGLSWTAESGNDGWSHSVEGNTLVIVYNGSTPPEKETLTAKVPESMAGMVKNSECLTIHVPDNRERDQTMICAVTDNLPTNLFLQIEGIKQTFENEVPVIERFRHKESFESNYGIQLQKYCAETGQALQDAVFDVLEAFDKSQLGNGKNGTVSEAGMTPSPAVWKDWKTCGQIRTKENGSAFHWDRKYYRYNKTYCGGHPKPEYMEIPEPELDEITGEITNQEEMEAADMENQRLREEWEALIALCEEETDFHAVEAGAAEEQMIQDRNETYQTFIELVYRYTVKEKEARIGYIVHGNHNDDPAIEVIAVNSSETGAGAAVKAGNLALADMADSKRQSAAVNTGMASEKVISVHSISPPPSPISTPSSATPANAGPKQANANNNLLYKSIFTHFYKTPFLPRNSSAATSLSLPEPETDRLPCIFARPSKNLSYTFRIENHRTEGEIHINKRDLDLYQESQEESYAKTQGDATLEGAVYGLYAAADLIHPDGKTGTVYAAGELTAIAATDADGNASFLAFTEESKSSKKAANRGGAWIGRPLLLGSYYIKEISRSEGYELSVTGMNRTQSNRLGEDLGACLLTGEVSADGLFHRIDDQDGSWNDAVISYINTEHGFDVTVTGYPEHSKIFEVITTESNVTEQAVIDSEFLPKTDDLGNPVYQLAAGGELKLDTFGKPIPAGGEDLENPFTEIFYTSYRTGKYPSGTAQPQIDPGKWEDSLTVEEDYIKEEVNDMLSQLGYYALSDTDGDGAPWITLELSGTVNETIGTEILDWYGANRFYNCGAVESIFYESGVWKAKIFYDYRGQSGNSIYDSGNDTLYIKKPVDVSGGDADSHAWIAYSAGTFHLNSFYARVSPKKQFEGTIPFTAVMEDYLAEKYQPLYERYSAGEVLLDLSGNPIPEMDWHYTYGPVTQTFQEETLVPVSAAYNQEQGTYTIHVENTLDWSATTEKQTITYRIQAPETSIVIDGKTMDYSDYLVQEAGAGVSVAATRENLNPGNYVRFQDLFYPGQIQVYQDGQTRERPVQVLERVIQQSLRVTKDISKESYEQNNTYQIHKDPFTVLFGGYGGPGRKYVKDFQFKLYLVSDLVAAGLLETEGGSVYNYKDLFKDETKRSEFDRYAVAWDRPERDLDQDLTTLHASEGTGSEPYYGRSILLPYGTYVIVEQVPEGLVNKHYELDDPKEVTLPFVPEIASNGAVQEETPSADYLYFSSYTPEELQEKFLIRFNEENHVIQAHNHSGDFEIYKYGRKSDHFTKPYENAAARQRYRYGKSEEAGIAEGVYYERLYDESGNVTDYGVILDQADTMTGVSTAVNGKYAHALVPWSVLDPRYGEVINDNGDIGNREPGTERGAFNFVAFAKLHFENTFYSSKLRVEKLDSDTGENIIHEGALFKIYATSRDVSGQGVADVTGTGRVLFETTAVTGTRPELEARGDVDHIVWDEENQSYRGTVTQPVYSESEQIFMLNQIGEEVGIFKAFSTEHTIQKTDGSISKEKTGYIQTYQPLGAGTYVLVEVQAPAGYQKSRPVAFEIYKNQAAYYRNGNPEERTISERFQYAALTAFGSERRYQELSQIAVTDIPSKLLIHKVEDGDQKAGDENGLDCLQKVNDRGDLLTYVVYGRKEYLEARGDVENITWDSDRKEYVGTVTKTLEKWSETLIQGSEAQLLARENVKPLYDVNTGYFSGYGIQFGIYVEGAVLSLYEGLQVEMNGPHNYKGVTVKREQRKVVSIYAEETGSRMKITSREREKKPSYLSIWDTEEVKKAPVELYFYDLEETKTEIDGGSGELWVLDQSGNRICCADSESGMAYTRDDYGNFIAYRAVNGEKVLARSIEVHQEDEKQHIYVNLKAREDENGLPLYYESGTITYRPEQWISKKSAHEICRLPFGAYILEETEVPYGQGYVKAANMGLILRESGEEQHFYYQNAFTKLNLAKVDVSTKKEIQGAEMTLYRAALVKDNSEKGYHLKKAEKYTSWISGYTDGGNEEMIPTSEPHWLDHLPAGTYLLEETQVPYAKGYVRSEPVEIEVKESANVQTAVMENDYTALEIRKYDKETGKVLDENHSAKLALYQAELDKNGNPVFHTQGELPEVRIPLYSEENLVAAWQTEDGAGVAATGREVTDEYGDTFIRYDYNPVPILATENGCYYITENGTAMFHYLPVGYYVLAEIETPEGYATAKPMLIEIEEKGHLQKIHTYEMPNVPLTAEICKREEYTGKMVNGALLQIYAADENGDPSGFPLYEWVSGSEPQQIRYIPAGNYILRETSVPYGFLQSGEVPFTIIDTEEIQIVSMEDKIPEGQLLVYKQDQDKEDIFLEGAVFCLHNKTRNLDLQTASTDETGIARFDRVPIGYINQEGNFAYYTYTVTETKAPDGYALNPLAFEFQFTYKDKETALVSFAYYAKDQQNQVMVSKQILANRQELPGAELKVIRKENGETADRWISTQQPHYINGLKEGEYTLIEVRTPGSGYALAEAIDFKIVKNMTEVERIVMYDRASETEIQKTAGNSGKLLSGARLQLSKEDGTPIRQWLTSEEPEKLYGLEPGVYVIKELEAPAGYVLGGTMKIELSGTDKLQVFQYPNYKKLDSPKGPGRQYVNFVKQSLEGSYLANAEFTFYRSDGSVLAVQSTDQNGRIRIEKPEPGTYTFKESKAPKGYRQEEQSYSFTVADTGEVTGDNRIINVQIPSLVGKIYANYQQQPLKKEVLKKRSGPGGSGAKTGEDTPVELFKALFVFSLAGLLVLGRRIYKRKGKGRGKLWLLVLFAGITGSIFPVKEAYAAQTVVITSPVFTDSAKHHLPADEWEQEGRRYRLKEYQVKDGVILEDVQTVTETSIFRNVEQTGKIPEVLSVQVSDEGTGEVVAGELSLTSYEVTESRWMTGFEFPITVQVSNADFYELGEERVPRKEEAPFSGYETHLLDLIEASPEYYRIHQTCWEGPPWTGEDGIEYRRAIASGEKLVRDIAAVYEGRVTFPEIEGKQLQAIYEKEDLLKAREIRAETRGEIPQSNSLSSWIAKAVTSLLVISVIPFILLAALVLCRSTKRKNEKRKVRE